MKKRVLFILFCLVTVMLLALAGCSYYSPSLSNRRTEYVIPENISLAIFSRTPEDFFDTWYQYYDLCEDFRNNADVDDYGNLVLRLTKEQENVLIDTCNKSIESAKKSGIEISKDLHCFTISGSPSEIENKIKQLPIYLIREMAIRQLLSNNAPSTISIECVVKDKESGKVVYNAIWPQESIDLDYNSFDFGTE